MSVGDLSFVLTFGFLSSLHCVQMCGPIVLSYSVAANAAQGRRSFLGLHLAYNAGRCLSYMLLGVIAGFAGGAMGWVGQLAGFQNAAAIGVDGADTEDEAGKCQPFNRWLGDLGLRSRPDSINSITPGPACGS